MTYSVKDVLYFIKEELKPHIDQEFWPKINPLMDDITINSHEFEILEGKETLFKIIIDSISTAKLSLILTIPDFIEDIVQTLEEIAGQKTMKNSRFLLNTNINLEKHGDLIEKILLRKNVLIRNLIMNTKMLIISNYSTYGLEDYLGKFSQDENEFFLIHKLNDFEGKSPKVYSSLEKLRYQWIDPIIQANSRPLNKKAIKSWKKTRAI